jgi:hypothetical protein
VGLHVDVLRAKELFRPLDGDVLDLVYLLAAAIVTFTRIALCILVRKDRSLRRQDCGRGEILTRDKL